MPTYKVFVTRDTTETATVEVEAETQEEAEDIAFQTQNLRFETDDWVGDMYVSDSEEIAP